MPPQVQRQVAHKIWLSQVHSSEYVKQQGWDPNYLNFNGKQISRVHVVATVVSKFIADDGNYATVTLDDGSDTIRVKAFGPDVKLIKEIRVGAIVRFIGKVKEYNEERYLSPEIIKVLEDPNWLIAHQLELGERPVRQPEGEQKVVSAEEAKKEDNLLKIISELDSGDGADLKQIIKEIGVGEEDAKAQIADLLASGDIFEPSKGKLKLL